MRFNTHRIELWFFLLIRAGVRRLPIAVARRLGALSGALSFYGFLRRRHYALSNLKLVFPELSRSERHRLARRVYRRTGASLLESAVWSTRDEVPGDDVFEVVGRDNIEGLLDSDRGFILLGAHYGVWETGLMPYEDALRPITVIAKRTTNPLMQEEADAWRARRGYNQILSAGATLKIFRALKRGDRVAFVADQRVQPEDGILMPFLGVPAWSSPMAAAISIRTGAPVLPFFAEPLGKDRYQVSYLDPIEADPTLGQGEDAIREMTRRYTQVVEERILAKPELWFWVHERWVRIKRYRWDSTKERWRKRSDLEANQDQQNLPAILAKVVKAYRRGRPLQTGQCLVVRGQSQAVREQVTAMGHAVIEAGRSFGWVEQGSTGRLASESFSEIDQFDAVAVLFNGSDSGAVDAGQEAAAAAGSGAEAAVAPHAKGHWSADRMRALLEHRLGVQRTVVLLLAQDQELAAVVGDDLAQRLEESGIQEITLSG